MLQMATHFKYLRNDAALSKKLPILAAPL